MIKNIIAIGLLIFALFLLAPTQGSGMTEKQIFEWVASELNIEKQYEMPKIQYVNKGKLQTLFKDYNKPAYNRWIKKHGKQKADEFMKYYLKEVIALFIPMSRNLYIGNFLEPCIIESIIAHELTHYYQHAKDGIINSNKHGAENKILYREMQAGNIEKKYMEIFCGKEGGKLKQ